MKIPIYLDYNATTPLDRRVADGMQPFLYDYFGNPSSSHPFGVQARLAIELARHQAARLINAKENEIIFTGGGTEANNLAIRGYCLKHQERGKHIITTAIEHPAVLEVCKALELEGFTLTVLPVDENGLVSAASLQSAMQADTILVSVMHANNEVGTIQPVQELTEIAHKYGAVFHCDAAQSAGKILVDVEQLNVDMLSLAGHKFYGPKGVGVLYVRNGVSLEKITQGANHERNLRPGTENTLGIAGFGMAAEIAAEDLLKNQAHFSAMRDHLQNGIIRELGTEKVRVNGHPNMRLPNTLSISFLGVQANQLLAVISDQVAASAGAACHADSVTVSSVLEAMHVPLEWAMGTLRFSTGRSTNAEEINFALEVVKVAVDKLNQNSRRLS